MIKEIPRANQISKAILSEQPEVAAQAVTEGNSTTEKKKRKEKRAHEGCLGSWRR